MKLRHKAMVILAAILLVSLGGSGLFYLSYYENAFRDAALNKVDSAAQSNAKFIADYLDIQKALVNHLSNYFPKEAYLAGDYEKIKQFLAEHFHDLPYFNNGFFFLDHHGNLIADFPPNPELLGKNFSFRPYFQETMTGKKSHLAQPYISKRTGAKVLTFTSYIETLAGEPIGMLGLSVDLATDPRLSEVRTQKHGKSGYNYIFDSTRLMILHPDETRILTRDVKPGVNKMYDAALQGIFGPTETVNSRGVKMFTAFYPVAGSDWILASQEPVADAMEALIASRQTMVFVLAGTILLTVTLGTYLVHRSMRHLESLERVTEELKIPEGENEILSFDAWAASEKLNSLMTHPEFGPLAGKICQLYQKLGGALSEAQQNAFALDEAYQKLKSSQVQILQQEKMASIGQLAAGVAHEINNPMGFISSNLGSLQRYFEKLSIYLEKLENWLEDPGKEPLEDKPPELKKKYKIDFLLEDIPELIDESINGADRVREIVQNLKTFSRVDQTDLCEADLNECLENTIAIAWNELKYKATLERDYAKLPMLSCYAQQLNQVFLNILINATQSIEEKGFIRIKTVSQEGEIRVIISDAGCGMSQEVQKRIFEPFFTTKDVGAGTGLGMSLSYEIVKKHGGDILLESQEGQGTTFTIVLPLRGEAVNNG